MPLYSFVFFSQKPGFLLGIFSRGAKSIVMQSSFVMLLFSDQISGRGKLPQGGAPCPPPPPVEESQKLGTRYYTVVSSHWCIYHCASSKQCSANIFTPRQYSFRNYLIVVYKFCNIFQMKSISCKSVPCSFL